MMHARHSRLTGIVLALFLLAPALSYAVSAESYSPDIPWPTSEWVVSSPADHKLSPNFGELVDQRLRAEAPLLSAFLVVKSGEIIVERYHEAYDPNQPLHTWSVSKSVTNLAVGIAIEEGLISSLDQTLGELIPDRIPANADPRVWDITIEQLLTMTAGWAWDSRVNFARYDETDDLDLMLTRPFQCAPGTCYEYDSGASNILAYIVQAVSGELMADYLQPRLFDPLGIDAPYWIVTEDGANRGGGGLHLAPRDMAKIGLLAMQDGRWENRRIIGREWLWHSTHPQSSGNGYLSGVNIGTGPYGYHWWIANAAGFDGYTAMGYGGQLIYVIPELELVIVTAYADITRDRPDLQQRPLPIIEELVVPTVAGL
jgi:CubicO group peptidase (beta-lactamase class C family)